MDLLSAILYGVIQGLTEFLPISSSGHLALLPHFLTFKDPGVVFDLMMHIGTALAVIIYFRKRIFCYVKAVPGLFQKDKKSDHYFIWNFVISTISSVLVILLIKDFAQSIGRTPQMIAINLMVFGLFLYLSDRREHDPETDQIFEAKISWGAAIFIGVSQAFAIFPGVSRSGITMTSARLMKLSRVHAGSYSFLLSLPIIFAGMIYKLKDLQAITESGDSLFILIVGVIVSFFVGLATIHFFLKLIARISFLSFFLYRLILGISIYAVIVY